MNKIGINLHTGIMLNASSKQAVNNRIYLTQNNQYDSVSFSGKKGGKAAKLGIIGLAAAGLLSLPITARATDANAETKNYSSTQISASVENKENDKTNSAVTILEKDKKGRVLESEEKIFLEGGNYKINHSEFTYKKDGTIIETITYSYGHNDSDLDYSTSEDPITTITTYPNGNTKKEIKYPYKAAGSPVSDTTITTEYSGNKKTVTTEDRNSKTIEIYENDTIVKSTTIRMGDSCIGEDPDEAASVITKEYKDGKIVKQQERRLNTASMGENYYTIIRSEFQYKKDGTIIETRTNSYEDKNGNILHLSSIEPVITITTITTEYSGNKKTVTTEDRNSKTIEIYENDTIVKSTTIRMGNFCIGEDPDEAASVITKEYKDGKIVKQQERRLNTASMGENYYTIIRSEFQYKKDGTIIETRTNSYEDKNGNILHLSSIEPVITITTYPNGDTEEKTTYPKAP